MTTTRVKLAHIAIIGLLGSLTLKLTTPFVLTILLVALLREQIHSNQDARRWKTVWLAVPTILALSSCIAKGDLVLNTLSTPILSTIVSLLLSFVHAYLSVGIIAVERSVRFVVPDPCHPVVLPVFWAFSWMMLSRISPIGRLATWTPVDDGTAYDWVLPITGMAGPDFFAASWAVVLSDAIAIFFSRYEADIPLVPIENEGSPRRSQGKSQSVILAGCLALLTIPGLNLPPPLPIYSSTTIPVTLACVLPLTPSPTLDDYLTSTKSLGGRADIMLWPEAAVEFRNAREREDVARRVSEVLKDYHHRFVGVSFVDRDMRQNGVMIVDDKGIVAVDYKRHLVPFTESFSLVKSSKVTMPLISLTLSGRDREIKLSTSICLDNAFPLPLLFTPHLILTPGKTWHPDASTGMLSLTQARAREVGTKIMWCDGGHESLSGVVGIGGVEHMQRGRGTWATTVGVPRAERPQTFYAAWGDSSAMLIIMAFALSIVGAGMGLEHFQANGMPRSDPALIRERIIHSATLLRTFTFRVAESVQARFTRRHAAREEDLLGQMAHADRRGLRTPVQEANERTGLLEI